MVHTGIVLAGGRSSRFGSNKAIYDFQGKTMLKHSVDLLRPFCNKILISGDKEEYYRFGYPCIPDKYGEAGPVGGIISSLEESDSELNIIVSCDMPLVTQDLLAKLLMNHVAGKITAFKDNHHNIYPFPIIIQKQHQSTIKCLLEKGIYKMQEMMTEVGYNTVEITTEEARCLANVNSPDDLSIIEQSFEKNTSATKY